jgi:hypothetical protein
MLKLLKVSVSKHAVMIADLDRDLPAIPASPAQLRQIVMNLVTVRIPSSPRNPREVAQPERWRMRRWSKEPRRISMVEGSEASLGRASGMDLCFIPIS